MASEIEIVFQGLKDSIADHRNEARSKKMSAYLRDQFKIYGLPSPLRRAILNPFYKEFKPLLSKNLVEFVDLCWADPYRELQYCGMDILGKCLKHLGEKDINKLEYWICNKSWWDTVDFLASTVAGHLIKSFPDKLNDYPEQWIKEDNIWLKRTAIIYQLKYKDQVDEERLFRFILSTRGSKEFFINKATGWSLRQYSRVNKEAVREFVHAHPELSNLTKREALKYVH